MNKKELSTRILPLPIINSGENKTEIKVLNSFIISPSIIDCVN